MHAALSGWPRPRNLFAWRSRTRLVLLLITLWRWGNVLTEATALVLLLLVPAEWLLWRFSSHSEHSSLLLAADFITDYYPFLQEQAATAWGRFFRQKLDMTLSM